MDLKVDRLDMDGVDRDLGYELLLAFWNRQHHSGSVVYRPLFMRDMASQGLYCTPLLLNAMLFVSSKHTATQSSGDDYCVDGMVFRRKAGDILYLTGTQLLTESSVTTAQALLLMAAELFSWCDKRSLAWHYLGIAINIVIDIGLHTTQSTYYRDCSAEGHEIGRRLFWAAKGTHSKPLCSTLQLTNRSAVADKVQSVYQGRPVRLRDADCSVPMSFLDEFEELEQFHSRTYSALPAQTDIPVRSLSTFEQLCKLVIISESIIAILYTEKSAVTSPIFLLQALPSLRNQLRHWRNSLPAHLDLQ